MFSVMELRLIRYSVKKTIGNMKRRLKILDPESDEAVEAKNDLMLYQNIIEKIDDRSDV
jgi:hypothetical protein